MKDKLKLFVNGLIMGTAFIIPGVSGGALAVILGVYDDIIEAICHIFDKGKFKKYFMFLLTMFIGIGISILAFSRVIAFGLEKTPVITTLIFIGLIVGGVPSLFKNIKGKTNLTDILCMFIGIVIVFFMANATAASSNVELVNLDVATGIRLFIVGILAAATIVIPGISGSFLLMMIGYYEPILQLINNITSFENVLNSILILIPFGVGVVIGVIAIAKLIEYCLKKYEKKTYYTILGFVLASILQVFLQVFTYSLGWIELTIGIVLMVAGAILVNKVFKK